MNNYVIFLMMVLFIIVSRKCEGMFDVSIDRLFFQNIRTKNSKELYKTEQVRTRPNKTADMYRQVGVGHYEVPEANERIHRKSPPFCSPVQHRFRIESRKLCWRCISPPKTPVACSRLQNGRQQRRMYFVCIRIKVC